ncbi:hypothetical protein J3458_001272 [Metarhizium acridum]|uniref:uncharacterized protein n=1 Tax=Metarhizium acridum TaxID=92637 RepID=UPI001C6BD6B7|nr:hypothetical protein J3458_001272 [Metarhizium acridum]
MPIAILAGLCYNQPFQSVPGHQPLNLNHLVHVDMRDVTEKEKQRVLDAGFDIVWGNTERKIDFGSELRTVLKKSQTDAMAHVDLDSLDASIGMANKMATYGGLLEADLIKCLEGGFVDVGFI